MPSDSPPAAIPAPDQPEPDPPSPGELFLAFAKMSPAGFGGVLGGAGRGFVEQHRWMTAEEFNEPFALCHFLPGPNIVTLSVVFGSRFGGLAGGLAAFAGLIGPPMLIAIVLAALYVRFGEIETLRRILAGIACAAGGALVAGGVRLVMPPGRERGLARLLVAIAA